MVNSVKRRMYGPLLEPGSSIRQIIPSHLKKISSNLMKTFLSYKLNDMSFHIETKIHVIYLPKRKGKDNAHTCGSLHFAHTRLSTLILFCTNLKGIC